jgi:hypothetical protein
MLTTLDNAKQTILPTMRSDIDGWQLDGVNDWELEAIFEDENDYETEMTTQGLINETDGERHQREKDAREALIDLYMWRVENGFDMFTGEDLGLQPREDGDDEESDSQE